uniref:NADH-ubiquinone oxidoreductase chain 2 n=1 Tax=Neolucanus maximus TaxID=618182 RepID=A0A346TLP3_9SCAR|nr:NADH dehydrogenase subunit 2 [Neolucanus maximus]AXU40283.1 NADH dehydrogenase subunit 2 [Neolucanus maximus]
MWNLNKILFLYTLALGTLMASSSSSWFGMWMGLEINLLSFIPLMKSTKNMYASEAALKYFIIQAIASTILLFSVIMMSTNFLYSIHSNIMNMALNSSLLLKMGAAPLHFWFPEVAEGLSWTTNMLLLTWQKIAPMVLFLYSNKTVMFIFIIVMSCMWVSGIIGQNQVSLRKIMAYSSINHIGWMIAASLFQEMIWVMYLLIYSIITLNILIVFKNLNIQMINQMLMIMKMNPQMKMFFVMNFLSLGGLPPFLGFLPKWMTVQLLSEYQFPVLAVTMIITTLMTLYFYMRLTFSSIVMVTAMPLTKTSSPKSSFLVFSTNLMTLVSLIMCTLAFNFL